MKRRKHIHIIISVLLSAILISAGAITGYATENPDLSAATYLEAEPSSSASLPESAVAESIPPQVSSESDILPEQNVPSVPQSVPSQPESLVIAEIHTVTFMYPEILLEDGTPHPLSGKVISSQQVEQGQSAIPPEGFELPENYSFTGWDNTSFNNVTSDILVKALFF